MCRCIVPLYAPAPSHSIKILRLSQHTPERLRYHNHPAAANPQNKPTLNSDVVYCAFKHMNNTNDPLARWLPPYTDAKTMARAHNKIAALVKSGALPRAYFKLCVICGYKADLYHHHVGYLPPDDLNVVPMCYACHTKVHNLPLTF